MKIRDRLWLWQNKKPQRPIQSYLQIAFLWTMYGVLLGWGMVIVAVLPKQWYIGAAVMFLSIIVLLWLYWTDRKDGYVDARHQQWVVRWLARKRRIEGEK